MAITDHYASEKHFLIGLALNQYNAQYKRNFKVSECDIHSIPARPFTDKGYEIITLRMGDEVRMHMFVTFGKSTIYSPYKLEIKAPYATAGLGDETYVMYAGVDAYYIEQDIYKFRDIEIDYGLLPLIWTENKKYILAENGHFFFQEVPME